MDGTKSQVDQALSRLEQAVDAIGKRAEDRELELMQRLETARQLQAAAEREAEQARSEAASLKALLDESSTRLDQAIERLQGLLTHALEE